MTRLEKIIQCILSIKLSAPQIFLFDGQAWKHDPMHTVITAIIICLCKKYFLFSGLTRKCFCSVYYQSQVHSKYFSLMVWLENIISWRLSVTTIYTCCTSIIHLSKNILFHGSTWKHFAVYPVRQTSLMVRFKKHDFVGIISHSNY